ncbi:MAG TPA: hypothetical protein VIH53_09985, partial [Gemmatimonadaceae bacterium]
LALSFIVYSLSNLGDNNRDGPQAVAFAVIQGLMMVLATLDLKNNKDRESRPIKLAQRLLGLALPLILLVVAFSVNQHALNMSRRSTLRVRQSRDVCVGIKSRLWSLVPGLFPC